MQPRRLVLVRHAQAGTAAVDADRPLTGLGERRAVAIGAWLDRAGLVPDRVLVSPARRAVQTWQRAGGGQLPEVDDRIYDNTVASLLAAVQDNGADVRDLVVVGHNPSIGELTAVLDDGRGDPVARQVVSAGFPTGGVAVLGLAATFAELAPGTARLDAFAVPDS